MVALVQISSAFKEFNAGVEVISALDDVSIEFEAGKLTAIAGVSGSGKSTLLAALAGLIRLDRGDVEVYGQKLTDTKDEAWAAFRRSNIAIIFQEYNLLPMLTVEENVALPLRAAGQRSAAARRSARIELEQLGLDEHIQRYPSDLSGGQRQRVAIARALAGFQERGEGLLLADEPTGALDSTSARQVGASLRTAADRGITVVVATHDPSLWELADRVVKLRDGHIIDDSGA